jgi:hypothetical protein
MKNKIITIVGVAVLAALSINNAKAVPITGNIGFDGVAQLNGGTVETSSKVVDWINTSVGTSSGSFASIAKGTPTVLASPWSFNSGTLNNFWTVGGFTFDLISSIGAIGPAGFMNVALSGTVKGNGFDVTAFNGTFQVADPSANGLTTFTERLSFNSPVPDGGNTLILLGSVMLAVLLVNGKYRHVLGMSKKIGNA